MGVQFNGDGTSFEIRLTGTWAGVGALLGAVSVLVPVVLRFAALWGF